MARVFNFSAGPAALPEEVLQQASEEMLDWQGSGMSVMEMSHRGKAFVSIAEQAEADLRELLKVPDNYKVLFLQGGATGQFSAIPMNLARGKNAADYVVNGSWSKKAVKEAGKYLNDVRIAAQPDSFTVAPADLTLNPDAAYLHYTPNETIEGVEFHNVPEAGDVPLVADMSSTILSRPIDVSKFGVIDHVVKLPPLHILLSIHRCASPVSPNQTRPASPFSIVIVLMLPATRVCSARTLTPARPCTGQPFCGFRIWQ